MTATITTLQNAHKTTLDAIPTGSRPVPFATRIAEADVTELATNGSAADVVIGFEASGRLGRTDSTILEQFLVPVTIKNRYVSGNQTDIANNHALAELLRDTLANYHSSTARVEQLLSPHPFDNPQAVGPGQYVSRFVLDMDVLRPVSTITTDVTTPSKTLSKVRRAVWDSFDNWSEWDSSTWARKFESDQDLDELSLHDPGLFDLPALAVTWGPTSPKFFAHTVQEWPATVVVTAWFPAHQTRLAEYRAWQMARAVYQCAPSNNPTMSYVRTATGRLPTNDTPIAIEPAELGRSQQLKALKLTFSFTLTGLMSPWNES